MTADEAMAWLRVDDSRVVRNQYGRAWAFNGIVFVCFGITTSVDSIPEGDTYTPFILATRSQVELERELTNKREVITNLEGHLIRTTQERDAAIGSQKAAMAALEGERAENKRLVNKVNALALVFDKTKRAIQVYEMDPVETAGKESG